MGFETVHQEWGRYSLIEIMQAPGQDGYIGFYNDIIQWRFAPENGFFSHSLGMLPLELAPPGGRIAIIGAGAGRQVQYARKSGHDFEQILAIEIEPAIIDAVRGSLADRFDHVYEDSRVQLVNHEARSHMESTDKRFDLIYLPSVGGYPQMMLEPGNMTARLRPLFQFIGGLFILLLLLFHDSLSPWANLALLAPVAFVTDSFFPALFEAAAENPLSVFAADSIGAAIGSMASFFIPIVVGFNGFFVFATVMFWTTALVTFLFFHKLDTAPAQTAASSRSMV